MPTIPSDPTIGDPTKASYAAAVNLALSDIASDVVGLESTGIPNSNFEILDGLLPAQWTITTSSGVATAALKTTDPLSGQRYLQFDTSGTGAGTVVLESAKINGGHLAVDLSMMYRTAATHPRFKVELVEYQDTTKVSELVVADYAADSYIAEDAIGLNINGLVGNASNSSGKVATFSIRITVGETLTNVVGTIDIDALSIVTRPDIISRREFHAFGNATTGLSKGWIYVPLNKDVNVAMMCWGDASTGPFCRFLVNGTASANSTAHPYGAYIVRSASLSLSAGIYSFEFQANAGNGWGRTLFTEDSDGTRAGLYYS